MALTSNGVGTCGADDNQAQAGHLVVQAVHENQRGEIATPDVMGTLKTGGGKPGQGYPCIVQPLALRGREGGAQLEIGPEGGPYNALRAGDGGSSRQSLIAVTALDLRNAARESGSGVGTQGDGWREGGPSYGLSATERAIPGVATETVVRRLTELECERLQGYPDDWTADQYGSPRYRQLGNSVAVPVVEWIARRTVSVHNELPLPVCWCCELPGACDCAQLIAAEQAAEAGKSAVISECGRYRYELRRVWDPAGPLLEFIMLNPSTADASVDDPTIRRIAGSEEHPGFARKWGYGGIVVRNLYALRATNPEVLLNYSGDSYGPRNDEFLGNNVADCTIVAWGAHAATLSPSAVATINTLQLCRPRLFCLGTNANGSPKHPLYVRGDRTPVRWEAA